MDAKRANVIMQWHADQMKNKSVAMKTLLSNSSDTRKNRLMKIQGYFQQVWKSMIPHIRKEFEYFTPDQIRFLISSVDAYIENLIRLGEGGKGNEIKILDVTFDGDQEQFEHYFGDEKEFRRITKNIILDIYNFIKKEKKENTSVFMKEEENAQQLNGTQPDETA